MPVFSIAMPLYNKAAYVGKAVASIVNQTFTDWELVVVDDGSTDESADIVRRFEDMRIKIIRQPNAGVGVARNRGVAEGMAPYICFLDADDWWEPTFLEEMSRLVDKYPDAGIYGTSYYIVKNGVPRIAPIGVDKAFSEGVINYCQTYSRTLCMPLWTGAVCMPRVVFDEMGGFPTNIKLGEDFSLWVQVALKYKVVLYNVPLSNYNQDVDITYRGTHHLHEPKEHMLWNLEHLTQYEVHNTDYKQMVDNLRTYSLLPYYLTKKYRDAARQELCKVNWDNQSAEVRRLYKMPVAFLRLRQVVLECGSKVKQIFLKYR